MANTMTHVAASGARTFKIGLLTTTVAALVGLVAGLGIARVYLNHLGQDQSWLLYAAQHVLGGAKLNSADLIETNPPFAVWFHELPVLLGQLLGVGTIGGFKFFWLSIAGGIGWWTTSLLRRLYRPTGPGLWMFVFCETVIALLVINVEDLGQREHVAAMVLLPYLIAAAYRLELRSLPVIEKVLIGLVASLGICLKPQQLLVIVVVECLLLIRLKEWRKWIDIATLVLVVGMATYLACVAAFGRTYLKDIVPQLATTYWGLSETWSVVLHTARAPLTLWVVSVAMYVWRRKSLRMEKLASVLLAGSIGAMLAYAQQHKGWHYQLICFVVFNCLLLGVMAVDLVSATVATREVPLVKARSVDQLWARRHAPTLVALVMAVLSFLVASRMMRVTRFAQPQKEILAEVYGAYPVGTHVGFLSVYPWEFPAVLEQDKMLSSRYMHLWMLGAIVKSQYGYPYEVKEPVAREKIDALSAHLRAAEAEDLARWKPAVVVVEPCSVRQFCDAALKDKLGTMLGWMAKDDLFRAEWSHYKLERSIKDLDVYTRLP